MARPFSILRKFSSIVLAAPLLMAWGCTSEPDAQTPGSSTGAGKTGGEPGQSGAPKDSSGPQSTQPDAPSGFEKRASQLPRITQPAVSAEQRKAFATGNLDLSLKMLRAMDPKAESNKAVSALSLRTAFGMVHGMARGQTQSEIATALNLPADPALAQAALNANDLELISRNLPKENEQDPVVFSTANRVFVSKEIEPGKAFLDLLAQNYGSGVYLADFKGNSGALLKEMNDWVSKQTHTRIPEIVTSQEINPATQWALINALYFKAPWDFAAEGGSTREFQLKDGVKKTVPFVSAPEMVTRYGEQSGVSWAHLPLRGGQLSLTLILPDAGKFDEVRNNLSGEQLSQWFAAEKKGVVYAYFPKFKIDSKRMNLIPMLKELGMKAAFNQADFGGYTDSGEGLIPITFVLQSVFVAADEKGVEAAAATAVGGEESAGPEPDKVLNVDRPFLFLVHDAPTGVALFAGQVLDPSS